jgi:hypothetical protein
MYMTYLSISITHKAAVKISVMLASTWLGNSEMGEVRECCGRRGCRAYFTLCYLGAFRAASCERVETVEQVIEQASKHSYVHKHRTQQSLDTLAPQTLALYPKVLHPKVSLRTLHSSFAVFS